MEKSSKRGKIPQHDWPSIIKRYEAGETLASIARTYDCSPPAISYIVNRTRARAVNGEVTTEPPQASASEARVNEIPPVDAQTVGRPLDVGAEAPAEPELVKSQPTETGRESLHRAQADHHTKPEPYGSNDPSEGRSDERLTSHETLNGLPRAGAGQNDGGRRTLHLQLPQSTKVAVDAEVHDGPGPYSSPPSDRFSGHTPTDLQQEHTSAARPSPTLDSGIINRGWPRMNNGSHSAKDRGAFIDQALRERVDGEITAFLAAFDAALAQDTQESRAGLREATDRLLRAGARTRIELERLEARVPLPAREAAAYAPPAWRPR